MIIPTADRYYKRICERIAADREAELENVELDSIVYSDGCKADNKLSLNGIHHKRIDHDKTLVSGKVHINGLENFRGYAKRRLKAYHGGFKRNDRLFIRERPIRISHRDDENALNYLGSTLRACS